MKLSPDLERLHALHNLESLSDDERAHLLVKSISSKEVAVLLGVTDESVRRWRVRGGGPPFYKVGGMVRYRIGALLAFMDSRSTT